MLGGKLRMYFYFWANLADIPSVEQYQLQYGPHFIGWQQALLNQTIMVRLWFAQHMLIRVDVLKS
jgi:hypothetical protein